MGTTRREFVERAGLAAAMGLVGGCGTRTDVSGGVLFGTGGLSGSTSHTFENWPHTIRFQPRHFCEPRTEQQVVDIVKESLATGTRVRTQGAGHSFSQLL